MKNLLFLILFSVIGTSFTYGDDTIYNWTDKDDVKHYTNQKQKIDSSHGREIKEFRFRDEENLNTQGSDTDYYESNKYRQILNEKEREQKELKSLWRNRAIEIENKIELAYEQIKIIKKRIEYLDNEIEYLLINGYSADYLIYELRTLENQIPEMETRVRELEEQKEQLKKEARKKGIPPGYIRP